MSDGSTHRRRLSLSRRELITAVLGPVAASLTGCGSVESLWSGSLPAKGELLSPDMTTGHLLRDGLPLGLKASPPESTQARTCVIVGGGVAGLTAARKLARSGVDDFEVLELESVPGGTSRSGAAGDFRFPWGAHYLPVPMPENAALIEFLQQIGVIHENGKDRVGEQHLCRDPEERVFEDGRWQQGLYPGDGASEEDLAQLDRFQATVTELALKQGGDGKRWFSIPTSSCSSDPESRRLDQISISKWMDDQGFTSARLRWLVDHSCRDDYGLRMEQTSAWAGLFYFSARIQDVSGETQPVMTWPEGNGFLVDQLAQTAGERLRCQNAVLSIEMDSPSALDVSKLRLTVLDVARQTTRTIVADHVVLAIPHFVAARLIPPELAQLVKRPLSSPAFQYGSWLVANVHLENRPQEASFPLCWDNVIYQSKSLGYVTATHQQGRDYGSTVLTWYQAIPDEDPRLSRQQLLKLTWADAAEVVLSDLEIAHPDIRPLVSRLDVMRWGHAMIQPRVGTVFHPDREIAKQSLGHLHFAGTDLSGMALFEEAFDHGVRAASEVVERL